MPKMQYYFNPDQFTEPPDSTAPPAAVSANQQAPGAGTCSTFPGYQQQQVIKTYISKAGTATLFFQTH